MNLFLKLIHHSSSPFHRPDLLVQQLIGTKNTHTLYLPAFAKVSLQAFIFPYENSFVNRDRLYTCTVSGSDTNYTTILL